MFLISYLASMVLLVKCLEFPFEFNVFHMWLYHGKDLFLLGDTWHIKLYDGNRFLESSSSSLGNQSLAAILRIVSHFYTRRWAPPAQIDSTRPISIFSLLV